jgi:hypothetical protein
MQPWAAFEAGPVETGDLRPADLPHRNMPLLRIDRINYQACTTIPLDAWVGGSFSISPLRQKERILSLSTRQCCRLRSYQIGASAVGVWLVAKEKFSHVVEFQKLTLEALECDPCTLAYLCSD